MTPTLAPRSGAPERCRPPGSTARRRSLPVLLATLLIALVTAPGAVAGQVPTATADSLRRALLLPLPPEIDLIQTVPRSAPGSSSGSPTAFGPNFGNFFVGLGFQARTRHNNRSFAKDADGSFVVGLGLGDARRYLGAEVALTSFSTWRTRPFSVSSVSFKIHRLLADNLGIAAGWENALMLTSGGDGGTSRFGVLTWVIGSDLPRVTASLGVGDGRFRFEEDVERDRKRVNPFGSLGIQLAEPVSIVADWTGQDLALALSIVPFARLPLIVTPGFADITGMAGDGARFIVGAGMGF